LPSFACDCPFACDFPFAFYFAPLLLTTQRKGKRRKGKRQRKGNAKAKGAHFFFAPLLFTTATLASFAFALPFAFWALRPVAKSKGEAKSKGCASGKRQQARPMPSSSSRRQQTQRQKSPNSKAREAREAREAKVAQRKSKGTFARSLAKARGKC
jgi:hypothetical protein